MPKKINKKIDENKIYNPQSGKYVLRTGSIGKKLVIIEQRELNIALECFNWCLKIKSELGGFTGMTINNCIFEYADIIPTRSQIEFCSWFGLPQHIITSYYTKYVLGNHIDSYNLYLGSCDDIHYNEMLIQIIKLHMIDIDMNFMKYKDRCHRIQKILNYIIYESLTTSQLTNLTMYKLLLDPNIKYYDINHLDGSLEGVYYTISILSDGYETVNSIKRMNVEEFKLLKVGSRYVNEMATHESDCDDDCICGNINITCTNCYLIDSNYKVYCQN